jgi:mRNA interferase MazF
MARNAYVPRAGDIVWIQFDPQAAHEQRGHRPALVLSPEKYNKQRGLMICCPLTTQVKGGGFEVPVVSENLISAVLVDHLKSVDWKARKVTFKEVADVAVVREAKAKIKVLLQIT